MLRAADISVEALANVLDQSVDCVKLLNADGNLVWMNSNGVCAIKIGDVSAIYGTPWVSLWPSEAHSLLQDAMMLAKNGGIARFDAFCPTAKGSPRWWNVSVSKVAGQDGTDNGFLSISRDVTAAEMRRQALEVAAEEMRHRLKNTYAIVGSLINGFAKGNAEHETFAKEMQSRLLSLSAAQSLHEHSAMPSDLTQLICSLVEPFASPGCEINLETGDGILISQGQADAVALIVGELAVNSAKHGAIAAGGQIEVSTGTFGDAIRISWIEQSNRPVAARSREGGQGLKLIGRIVAARNGRIDTEWGSHGPMVTVEFPTTPAT